jgi:hypothetical protein
VESPLCWRVALLPRMVRPRGRCVVVVPLDACSLVLGSVLPYVIFVRCGAIPTVGLLHSIPSTPYLIQYVTCTLLKKSCIYTLFVDVFRLIVVNGEWMYDNLSSEENAK